METASQNIIRTRQSSRRLLVQALYQWQLNECDAEVLIRQYAADEHWEKSDPQYFCQVLRGVIEHYDEIVERLAHHMDRKFEQIDPVERAVLLLSTYEIQFRRDIPPKVAITEAVRLTKKFGAQDGFRYVNAVLDKLTA